MDIVEIMILYIQPYFCIKMWNVILLVQIVYTSLEKVFHSKNSNFYVFLHLMISFSY